jgi:hypothetical protein
METASLLHVAACVVVPAIIALVMYLLFGAWDRRRRRNHAAELPPIDYLI